MKSHPPIHIAFKAKGRREWIGGVEYIRNLANSINLQPENIRKNVKLSLLVNKGIDSSLFKDFFSLFDHVIDEDSYNRRSYGFFSTRFREIQKRFGTHITFDPRLTLICKENKIDFVYPLLDMSPVPASFDWASWIPDLQHCRLPHFFSEAEIRDRDDRYQKFFHFSSKVVMSSHAAKNDVIRYYPQFDHSKIRILHFHSQFSDTWISVDPHETRKKYNLPQDYLVVCNQLWKHKNHKLVLEALKKLNESGTKRTIVMTGALDDYRDPSYFDSILQLIHQSGLKKQVYILGLVPRFDQIQIMRAAIAVLQPSLFEGWSTVVEDARALGKKIVLSDIDVHLEQKPDHGTYFRATDVDDLAEKISRLEWLLPASTRQQEAEGLLNSKKLSASQGQNLISIASEKRIR